MAPMTARHRTGVSRTFVLEVPPLEEGADVELVDVGAQLVERLGTGRRGFVRQGPEAAEAEARVAEVVVVHRHVVIAQVHLSLGEPRETLDLELLLFLEL